jgi:hypothetical protein
MELAWVSCSFGTMNVMIDWLAGQRKASKIPKNKANTVNSVMLSFPDIKKPTIPKINRARVTFEKQIIRILLNRSPF